MPRCAKRKRPEAIDGLTGIPKIHATHLSYSIFGEAYRRCSYGRHEPTTIYMNDRTHRRLLTLIGLDRIMRYHNASIYVFDNQMWPHNTIRFFTADQPDLQEGHLLLTFDA